MWMELFIEYNGPSLLCEFVSHFTQATDKNLVRVLKIKNDTQKRLNLPEMPFLIVDSENIIKGEYEICKFIGKLTGTNDALFGISHEEEQGHKDFIHKFNLAADYIPYLNDYLSDKTFCQGNVISISDLYAFSFTIQEILQLSDSKKNDFCHVIRWAYHIQNLPGMRDQLERLKFTFRLPYEPLLLEPHQEEKKEVKQTQVNTGAKDAKCGMYDK